MLLTRPRALFSTTITLLVLVNFFPMQKSICQLKEIAISGEGEVEPWELQDVASEMSAGPPVLTPIRLPQALSLEMIHWYKRDISPRSIQRCPYYPSCSTFAEEAIRRHGFFIGLMLFIDRNLYRENPQMYQFYDLVSVGPGILKLDDRFFLDLGNR